MRVSKLVLFLALCVPVAALADGISRISPSSINVGNVEEFMNIFGENLAGSELTTVVYSGPGGTFEIEPVNVSSSVLTVWIPVGVAIVEGDYTIDVYAKDIDVTEPRHYGPVTFSVVVPNTPLPPLLSVPEAVLVDATNNEGAAVEYVVSAQSQTGTGLTFSCSPASGSFFSMGTTIVSCTATDSDGSTSASFAVIVSDATPPVLTLPADITTDNPVVTFTASAVDNLDGSVPVNCSPASGSTFAFGTTTVVCDAYDSRLNYTSGTFDVYVSGGPPELILPDTIYAGATSETGAIITYDVTATEGGVVSCSPASGTTFTLGLTTVNCTATNSVGSTSGSFDVYVVAVSTPTVTITTNPKTLWPPNHQWVNVTLNVVAVDALDPNPVSVITSVTSSQPIEGTGDGDAAPDWEITGPLTLKLRSERSHGVERVYMITVLTTNNNTGSVITQVLIKVTNKK